jgi:hypothetical protein
MKKKQKKMWELHRHFKKWTPEEEDLLKQLYPGGFSHELVDRFGRTKTAIGDHARKLGIKKNWRKPACPQKGKRWSKKEIKRLKKLYPVMPIAQLLQYFPKRTKAAIAGMAQTLGLRKNGHNENLSHGPLSSKEWLWSAEEIEQLRTLWRQGYTETQIAEIMGLKVRYQIDRQIHLNELKGRSKGWSAEEEEYLRHHYHTLSNEQIAVVLGRTASMLHHKATRLKITAPNYWSPEEIETLRRLWQQGKTCREIGETLGKTEHAVDHAVAKQQRDFGLPERIKHWSKEEQDYLIKHFQSTSLDRIAAALGRTKGMTQGMARRLKLIKRKSWTVREIDLLKEHFSELSNSQVAKLIGTKSRLAVKEKAKKLGLKKAGYNYLVQVSERYGKLWTSEEDAVIQNLHPTMSAKELATRLDRTVQSIVSRAGHLNVKFTPPPKPPAWSEKEIETLRQLWQQGHTKLEIAELIGKSAGSVQGRISKEIRNLNLQKRCERDLWSKEEIAYLIEHYQGKSAPLSAVLGKTTESIRGKAFALGLTDKDKIKLWTVEETEMLKQLRQEGKSIPEIAKLIDRTPTSVANQIRKLIRHFGLQKKSDWTSWSEADTAYLIEHYNTTSARQLTAVLGKTISSIHCKAQSLDLAKKTRLPWTAEQTDFLKEYYHKWTIAQISQEVGHTPGAVQTRACQLGLCKT